MEKLIEFYYSNTCPNCHRARKKIMEVIGSNVTLKEFNIESETGRRKAEKLGIWSVPTLVVGGEIVMEGEVDEKLIERLFRGDES